MPIYLPPVSRRRFLQGSLAAAAGLLLPCETWAAERPVDADRWVLLADTHVWEHRDGSRRGTKPADTLLQAVAEIVSLDPRPAGVILVGDTVYLEGHAADYAMFRRLVQPIREAGIPLHIALGNHDDRANFWTAFAELKSPHAPAFQHHVAVVETPRVNWFLLDSLDKTNSTPGLLGKPQLDWLAAALDARRGKPAILAAHHDLGTRQGLRHRGAVGGCRRPRRGAGLLLWSYPRVARRQAARDALGQCSGHRLVVRSEAASRLAGRTVRRPRRHPGPPCVRQEAPEACRAR